MSAPVLRLEGVRVTREGRSTQVPDLVIARGEAVAVAGPNGSGKSTLLMAAAGLIDLAAGRVEAFGELFHQGVAPGARHLRCRVVYAAQAPLLLAGSVQGNLAWGLRFRGMPRTERRARVAAWLPRLGIAHLAARSARHLSGGEQRLVALARAFVLEPELLLLDEPFTHLDAAAVPLVETLVNEVTAGGTTLLLATHDREQAARLVSRVIDLGQLDRSPSRT
jgi:ABC-type sulfate/molybdate transport systems ATPase subunit